MVQRDVEQIVGGDAKLYTDTFTYSRGYQMMTLTRTDNVNLEVCTYTMGYDYNGNMTSMTCTGGSPFTDPFYEITKMEFQYDLKNRLTKYRFGGEGYWNEIKYDALGRVRERISADETPITKKFYSDGRQLIQQLDNGNNAEFDYLRGPTGLDRQWNESSEKRYFYIKDPLGTVWAMIESGFTPQQSPIIRLYNYNAWGEHIDASDVNFPDYDDDPNLMRYIGSRVEAFGRGTETQRDVIYHLDHRHYMPFLVGHLQRDPLFYHRKGKPFTGIIPQGSGGIEPVPPLPFICDQETPPVDEEPNPEPNLPGTPPNPDPNWPIERCWCPCIIPIDLFPMIRGIAECAIVFGSALDKFPDVYVTFYGTFPFPRQFTCCDQFGAGISNIMRWLNEIMNQISGELDIPPILSDTLDACINEFLCKVCQRLLSNCIQFCPPQTNPLDVCDQYCEGREPTAAEIIRRIFDEASPFVRESVIRLRRSG
jgi:hypothetical protein